jgi:hypothetical protein
MSEPQHAVSTRQRLSGFRVARLGLADDAFSPRANRGRTHGSDFGANTSQIQPGRLRCFLRAARLLDAVATGKQCA